MTLIQLSEQKETLLPQSIARDISPCMGDDRLELCVRRGRKDKETCLLLKQQDDDIIASSSYFVGIDWLSDNNVAVQVNPKMNDEFEVDYVRMLNDALSESDNYAHLKDLVTIRFDKPSIKIKQQQDLLSIFLIVEYLNIIQRIVINGLKKSFYMVEKNLHNKIKGRILVGQNIRRNIVKGHITDTICRYQVYGIDTPENRILKMALRFCIKQLGEYKYAFNTEMLNEKARFARPYFNNVSDEVCLKTVKYYRGNPVYRDYNQAVEIAQLLLRRYSYDITIVGNKEISTPPFWIDMSKLFELYVFHHLRRVFTAKKEIRYHVHKQCQELDYLLNPELWSSPYVIDAKYKPKYKSEDILTADARQVAGYARLSGVYKELKINEEALPIKCLIIYPDQEKDECFTFTREKEPTFEKIKGYVRFYKLGIRLPLVRH